MIFKSFYEQYVTLLADPKYKGYSNCTCPFHKGNKVNTGVDLYTGMFNCFKCGTFSPVKFLRNIIPSISLSEANHTIDEILSQANVKIQKDENDLNNGFTTKWTYNKKFEEIYNKSISLDLRNDLVASYIDSRGLSIEILNHYGVKVIKPELTAEKWNRESLVFPYVLGGRIVGLRYRDIFGNKYAESGSYMTPWAPFTESPGNTSSVILEGESDTLRMAQSCILHGIDIDVYGLPGARFAGQWEREFYGYENIIFIPQSDLPAKHVIEDASKCLGKERFSIMEIPWKRGQIGKDICDWLSYNTDKDLVEKLSSKIKITKKVWLTGMDLKNVLLPEHEVPDLIENLVAPGQLVFIGGKQKSKKTWVLLELLRTLISKDENFLGIPKLTSKGNPDRKILIIEEEGSKRKFVERIEKVFDGLEWEKHITLAHRFLIKLDSPFWIDLLCKKIEEEKYTDIAFDPLQRLHSKDENDSTSLGPVFDTIHLLFSKFPEINQYIIHHFNKMGDIKNGWDSFRGTSRTGGEADLGIFVQKGNKGGIKIAFDGRDLENIESPSNNGVFNIDFDEETCRLKLDPTGGKMVIIPEGPEALYEFLEKLPTKTFEQKMLAVAFKKNEKTISRWAKMMEECVEISKPSRGKPTTIKITGPFKKNELKIEDEEYE